MPASVLARIGSYQVGPGHPLLFIAGPCVLENHELTQRIARSIAEIVEDRPVQWIFKASFDKANRTRGDAFRGPGMTDGLDMLRSVRDTLGVPVTTDIHLPDQAEVAASVCDLLQIPAFLCRQTDLLMAAGRTGKAVNVKKGQFVAPEDMAYAVEKLRSAGCKDVLLCERGNSFGYGRLVVDMQNLLILRNQGAPVVFDATHSVQQPGKLGGATGGNRDMVAPLARAAAAVGMDGLFVETHPEPDASPSDGANMVALGDLSQLLDEVLAIRDCLAQNRPASDTPNG